MTLPIFSGFAHRLLLSNHIRAINVAFMPEGTFDDGQLYDQNKERAVHLCTVDEANGLLLPFPIAITAPSVISLPHKMRLTRP